MELRISERKQAKIKMALEGSSGSCKTYSALLIAYGICNNWNKIAVIDTESGSADLYAHLGSYNVLNLSVPFSPERYIQAIELCEKNNIEIIIIDSISHCWDFLLDFHANLTGANSFANWGKVTPRQNAFVQKILNSPCHVIATMRTKQDYVLNEKNGKLVPEKVGLKPIQRDGLDYEFTIVFDISSNHRAVASKDRTGLFIGKPEFLITPDTGKQILDWCNSGTTIGDVKLQIQNCNEMENLIKLFKLYPQWYSMLEQDFITRKQQLQNISSFTPTNIQSNGTPYS